MYDKCVFVYHSKKNWEYYSEEKPDSERLLIILNIKMLAKLNKI